MYGGRNAETLRSRTQPHRSKFSQTNLYIKQPRVSPIYMYIERKSENWPVSWHSARECSLRVVNSKYLYLLQTPWSCWPQWRIIWIFWQPVDWFVDWFDCLKNCKTIVLRIRRVLIFNFVETITWPKKNASIILAKRLCEDQMFVNTNIFHDMHNKLLTLHVVRALIDRLYVCLQSDPKYLSHRETSVLQN